MQSEVQNANDNSKSLILSIIVLKLTTCNSEKFEESIYGVYSLKNGFYLGLGYFIGINIASFLFYKELKWQGLVSGVIGLVIILISTALKNKKQ